MKLPELKIPTKDLPLFALGVTAVLVSSIFGQPLVQYILTAIFFGILSRETRWKYWGAILLINAFFSFQFLLRTDHYVLVVDSVWWVVTGLSNMSLNVTASENVWLSSTIDALVEQCANNPIYINVVVLRIVSTVLILVGVVLSLFTVLAAAGYVIVLLPVFGHVLSMLYIFHRNELVNMMKLNIAKEPIPEYVGRLVTPYLIQGIAIEVLLMTAILPLIFYKILKWVGFYDRIPNIGS